jgi:hypothetical protein
MQSNQIVTLIIAIILICYRIFIIFNIASSTFDECKIFEGVDLPPTDKDLKAGFGPCINGYSKYYDSNGKQTFGQKKCSGTRLIKSNPLTCIYGLGTFRQLPQILFQIIVILGVFIVVVIGNQFISRVFFIISSIFAIENVIFANIYWFIGISIASVLGNLIFFLLSASFDYGFDNRISRKRTSSGRYS